MEKAGKSARLHQLVLIRLHQVLNLGVKYGWLTRNTCDLIEKPKTSKRPAQVLEPQQVVKFLEAAKKDRLYALYILALTTGMRFGEMLALHWKDISLSVRPQEALEFRHYHEPRFKRRLKFHGGRGTFQGQPSAVENVDCVHGICELRGKPKYSDGGDRFMGISLVLVG